MFPYGAVGRRGFPIRHEDGEALARHGAEVRVVARGKCVLGLASRLAGALAWILEGLAGAAPLRGASPCIGATRAGYLAESPRVRRRPKAFAGVSLRDADEHFESVERRGESC